MGNVFMRKTENVFETAKIIKNKMILKKNVDFIIVDFHGEITSEKMAIGHFLMVFQLGLLERTHTFQLLILEFYKKEQPIRQI